MIIEMTNAVYATKLLEQLDINGVNADDLRLKAGITASEIEFPESLLQSKKYHRLVELALQQPETPYDLGFRVGEGTQLLDHGIMGYAILNSHDMHQCMQRYIRYLPLTGPVMDVSMQRQEKHMALRLTPLVGQWNINIHTLRYFTQEWLASLDMWGNLIDIGRGLFTEVKVAFAADGHENLYRRHLHCPISFNHSVTEALFPEKYLTLPFSTGNDSIGDICEAQCQRLLADLEHHQGWSAQVYQKLSRSPKIPNITKMADLLHISPRTLRRRLEQDGKTYQQLVVDFRMAMARQYLTETKLPVNEIADLIGYSNPANFYRTFRQIEQMTPQNYRSQYR